MQGRSLPQFSPDICRFPQAAAKPCEFLTVDDGEFVWDRKEARLRFEAHLERESNKGVGRNETPLDGIWRATESTISDVVAHIPVRAVPQVQTPENVDALKEWAIATACKETGLARGYFGNKRASVRAIGFAYVMLRVHVSSDVVVKMLSRSRVRLWDAQKRLSEQEILRAGKLAEKMTPEWKGPAT